MFDRNGNKKPAYNAALTALGGAAAAALPSSSE
ncbi:hypothetical protein ACWD3P_46885 [Streptomyces sp. NPDC002765]